MTIVDILVDLLELNVTKTKKVFFDFSCHHYTAGNNVITGQEVEIAESYEYFGTTVDNKLTFDSNTYMIYEKTQQHLL